MQKALMIFYPAINKELPEVNRIFQNQHPVNMVIKYSLKMNRQSSPKAYSTVISLILESKMSQNSCATVG